MRLLIKRLRERSRQLALLQRELTQARQDLLDAHEQALELARNADLWRERANRAERRLRDLNIDRLIAENADLHAEAARLRSVSPTSREEYLRERETNARLMARLELMEAGQVTL